MTIKRTERGWGGHFILASRCRFRRNTLLEDGAVQIVVSTVGNMWSLSEDPYERREHPEPIGSGRIYETGCFHAHQRGAYLEADTDRRIHTASKSAIAPPWFLEMDIQANDMHENAVTEIIQRMEKGELT